MLPAACGDGATTGGRVDGTTLDLAQDDQPAVRGQAAGIERGCERLGSDR